MTHDMTINQLSEYPPELSQCLLPFTIYKLSGLDLTEQASYSLNSGVFGVTKVAIPFEGRVWLGNLPNTSKMNPFGKAPTFQDGTSILFESGAIIEFILEKYAEGL